MNIKEKFFKYYTAGRENRKYLLIYFVLVFILTLSIASLDNYLHPKFEIIVFLLTIFSGVFSILYYKLHDSELHKVAFVIIICFGLVCAFLTPIGLIPDEQEHLIRSEMTSNGVIVPEPQFENSTFAGFNTPKSVADLAGDYGNTAVNSSVANSKIDYSNVLYTSAFMQNPFFGYLAQAIGIAIAKLLDLSVIWMLWLGRCANLILYALLVSLAVKKAPVLKIPLIAMACIPLAIFQAASLSIDAAVNGLAFLAFGYFLNMLKSNENTLNLKNIGLFSLTVLLLALCKLPYLAFIFLLFIVPRDKFKTPYYYNIAAFLTVAILVVLWARFYAMPNYMFSYRANYFLENNVSMQAQFGYLSAHLKSSAVTFANVFNYIGVIMSWMFLFSFPPFSYESDLLTVIGLMFMGAVIFLYPNKDKLSSWTRIGLLIVMLIVFYGTFTIQLLTWSSVGVLYGVDLQARYFIPLLAMAPFVFGVNSTHSDDKKIDLMIIIASIVLLSAFNILTLCRFY